MVWKYSCVFILSLCCVTQHQSSHDSAIWSQNSTWNHENLVAWSSEMLKKLFFPTKKNRCHKVAMFFFFYMPNLSLCSALFLVCAKMPDEFLHGNPVYKKSDWLIRNVIGRLCLTFFQYKWIVIVNRFQLTAVNM